MESTENSIKLEFLLYNDDLKIETSLPFIKSYEFLKLYEPIEEAICRYAVYKVNNKEKIILPFFTREEKNKIVVDSYGFHTGIVIVDHNYIDAFWKFFIKYINKEYSYNTIFYKGNSNILNIVKEPDLSYRKSYYVELSDNIREIFSKNERWLLNYGHKNNYMFEYSKSPSNCLIVEFRKLYIEKIKNKTNKLYHIYYHNFFEDLFQLNNFYMMNVSKDGINYSYTIFLIDDCIAYYYLVANDHKLKGANTFLLYNAYILFRKMGIKYVFLGYGMEDGDSLSNFKRHCSNRVTKYYSGYR